ncbi:MULTISPECIES: hypothetical protein [Spirosoma]|uniref:Uncharacterized protein n=1 Tax=Spirosoma aureum TaxID=2692134 RepID=A0A6G9AQR1_9BACT|nr:MULTISPECIES: hypothetical protein [Spirosoma]QIP14676.1 hypothetical protein G8759_19695 [Spirosoma aureum]
MAHEQKKNKNIKKVATKAPKVHGSPKVPKYEQKDVGITPPGIVVPSKKDRK